MTLCGAAFAQTYPSKPVRLVVPFPPGGSIDLTARILAEELTKRGTTFVVENRPGAGGTVASAAIAKAKRLRAKEREQTRKPLTKARLDKMWKLYHEQAQEL